MISTKFIRLNLALLLMVSGVNLLSQEKDIRISMIYPDGVYGEPWIRKTTGVVYPDSLKAIEALHDLRDKYYESGYLGAGFDSLIFGSDEINAIFYPGLRYEWGRVEILTTPSSEIGKFPRSIGKKSGKTLRASDVDQVRHEMISLYEDNGYPFASASFESLVFEDNSFSVGIKVDPGPAVYFDSIINRSTSVISEKVLSQIVRIKKGQPYSEKKIRIANQHLENNELLSLAGPVEVGFAGNKAWVYLSPEKRRSNSFDGLIGLAPGGGSTEKFTFTGSLDLILNNTFKQAESFKILWKAPGNQNQRFNAGLEFPWLFGWPIGLLSDFELYKKDSSYLNTDIKVGLITSLGINNRIGFYFRQKASNILLNEPGPGLAGYNINLYGISWRFVDLINPLNPSSGVSIETELGLGRKEFGEEGLENRTQMHFESRLLAELYIPVARLLVFNFGVNGAYLNGENAFENEKYKLGGIFSLRGFGEESILADNYLIGTAELRYLFSRNSNFHIFVDTGKWWSLKDGQMESDFPLGAGLGLSLETNAGIIMLDYALGRSGEMPFNLRSGKIHLGIKSIF